MSKATEQIVELGFELRRLLAEPELVTTPFFTSYLKGSSINNLEEENKKQKSFSITSLKVETIYEIFPLLLKYITNDAAFSKTLKKLMAFIYSVIWDSPDVTEQKSHFRYDLSLT